MVWATPLPSVFCAGGGGGGMASAIGRLYSVYRTGPGGGVPGWPLPEPCPHSLTSVSGKYVSLAFGVRIKREKPCAVGVAGLAGRPYIVK